MTDKQIIIAYQKTLDEIEKHLKKIHYPLCNMEKYAFDYETDEVDEEVRNIHKGYMQIIKAISNLRKLKGLSNGNNNK